MPVISLGIGLWGNLLQFLLEHFRLPLRLGGRRSSIGMIGVDPDRIDYAIDTDMPCEPLNGFHRIFHVVVNHFRALTTSHRKAVSNRIDGEDVSRSHQFSAENSELADRT